LAVARGSMWRTTKLSIPSSKPIAATVSALKGCKSSLRNLRIMIRGVEACADTANNLPINDNWKAALHLGEVTRCYCCKATLIDCVLE